MNIPVRTRSIADAAGLTIYQARAYLVTLEGAGVVEKMNVGKGVSGRWRLV
ncbi:faeA-like family protein [Salmonella enterica subsp. enterica serovar Kentucky]|nr:faeA-like family protein [Salmonella enterica subsp. enterica serovar Kentucky]EGI4860979.1 faeA-like family protein [Salmonella enterica subsp. enterica serovar Kentucky]